MFVPPRALLVTSPNCCLSERIVIELEGDVRDAEDQRAYDRAPARFLEAAGYSVIRVRNKDVSRERLEAVLRTVLRTNSL